MATHAGVGMSHHRNPRVAGREAAEKALQQAGIDRPEFVFMFATVGYDQGSLLRAVREATDGARLSGCSVEGIIAGGEADESNFSVAVMVICSDELRFSHGITGGLKENSAEVGRAVAREVRDDIASDTLGLFVFMDGLTLNFDRFVNDLEGELNLGRQLPVLGSASADNWAMKRTYQYSDDEIISDGVAWTLLSGNARLAWTVNHGCMPIGSERKVTRCEGNIIHEIDGKPALDVVREYLTEDEVEDWGKVGANLCFAFKVPGHMKDYDEYIIHGMAAKDDATGSVLLGAEVMEGVSIWVTRRDYEKIASGVDRMATQINGLLDGSRPKLLFQFDCAGRGKVFLRNQHKQQLLARLQESVGPDVPWIGSYGYGEISPVGEHNCYHNFTAVLTAIY